MDASTMNAQAGNNSGGPPSSGRSIPGWLKVTGIGCAVLVLVGGLLLALAVFRTAACCSQFGELAENARHVQQEGYEFAGLLHRGDFDQAYDRLDDSAREMISRAEFEERFADARPYLEASEPFPVRLDIDEADFDFFDASELDRWYLTTHFGEPQFEEVLQVRFVARSLRDDGDGDSASVDVRIKDWELELVDRDFQDFPYAGTADRFISRLQRGDFENLRHMIAFESELGQLSAEELTDELAAVADVVDAAGHFEVFGVYPHGVETAVARVALVGSGDTVHFVDIAVGWQDQVWHVSEPELAQIGPEALRGIDAGEDVDEPERSDDDNADSDEDIDVGDSDNFDQREE